jgi:TfoX/Sxy family transcriptional regulator of competence genes
MTLQVAFDEGLAERVRSLARDGAEVSEHKMFGGLCFMAGGNMCFGIVGSELIVRVGPDAQEAALALPSAREMDFTGRPMRGKVYVSEEAISEDDDLQARLRRGLDHGSSLPAK